MSTRATYTELGLGITVTCRVNLTANIFNSDHEKVSNISFYHQCFMIFNLSVRNAYALHPKFRFSKTLLSLSSVTTISNYLDRHQPLKVDNKNVNLISPFLFMYLAPAWLMQQ